MHLQKIILEIENTNKKTLRLNDVILRLHQTDRFDFLQIAQAEQFVKQADLQQIYRFVCWPKSPLFEIKLKSLPTWLKFLITKDLTTIETVNSELISKCFPDIKIAMTSISTHVSKLAEPKSDTSGYFPAKRMNSTLPYVCSKTIQVEKQCTLVNATKQNKAAIIETEFIYNGKIFNIFKALYSNETEILSVLLEIGFSAEQIKELSMLAIEIKDNGTKLCTKASQVCFPVGDKKYHSLTLLPSIAVSRAINLRVPQYFDDPDFCIITDRIKVGGNKPLNAGTYNVSIGGLHTRLKYQVYSFFNKNIMERNLSKVFKSRTLFRFFKNDFIFYNKTPPKEWSNQNRDAWYEKIINNKMKNVWKTYYELEHYFMMNSKFPQIVDELPLKKFEKNYIQAISQKQTLDNANQKQMAVFIYNKITSNLPPGRSFEELEFLKNTIIKWIKKEVVYE